MQNDRLCIEEIHTKAAQKIVEYVIASNGEKLVIGISGETGSGKAELSLEIASLLRDKNRSVKILHIDNYYKIPPHKREKMRWRSKEGLESIGILEYDWDAINHNLVDFRDKEISEKFVILPCIDLLTDKEDQLITSFAGIKYLVIEGLYAIKAEVDLRVFIDITYHETLERDPTQLSRGKEKLDERRMQVLEQEHKVVRSLRPLADLIVDKDYQVVEA